MEIILFALACYFLIGGILVPLMTMSHRHRLREMDRHIEELWREIERLRREVCKQPSEGVQGASATETPSAAAAATSAPAPWQPAAPQPGASAQGWIIKRQPSGLEPPRLAAESTTPEPAAAEAASGEPPSQAAPPITPPTAKPPMPPPAAPAAEPAPGPQPSFDWEALLGVRAMAWIGAVALTIAGLLFAKYSIERGYFTPAMRFGCLLAAGVGSLVGAEFVLRKGYETTCNALCGAGVALLYAGLFAGHALYGLVGLWPTFIMMALVTVVAGLMAIRYNAMFIAILGLLGGFATPLVLSTGVDRPIGLFSYILLLDAALIWIAIRKGWTVLAQLSLAGTLLIETLWTGRFLTPEKLLIGMGAYALFGALYLFLPRVAGDDARRRMLVQTSIVGGLAPFAFALYIAGSPGFAAMWPMLFGFIALLDAAMAWVGLRRAQAHLVISAALATVVTTVLWSAQGLGYGNRWGASLAVVGLTLLLNAIPRAARRLAGGGKIEEGDRALLESSGLIAGAGLYVYALIFLGKGLGVPPWCFLGLLAGLSLVVWERSRPDKVPALFEKPAALFGPAAIAVLAQFWFFHTTRADSLTGHLAVPALLATAWSGITGGRMALRARARRTPLGLHHEDGAAAAAIIAIIGVVWVLTAPALKPALGPLFAALGVLSALLVIAAVRSPRTQLLTVGVAASAVLAFAYWRMGYFKAEEWGSTLAITGAAYLGWLALPFAMPKRLAPHWAREPWPWLASALAGPLLFFVIYKAAVAGFGKGFIGALPVAMAALSLAGLAQVRRLFVPSDDPVLARQRLRNLALFAAVALGFISVAIPLQLDRQWITIGWALEGAAVWRLYRRLPHIGLKYFGFALFMAVGARLLLNPAVLRYEERGLPILNWILYTYGVAAACCIVGAALLQAVERARMTPAESEFYARCGLAPVVGFLGLILIFALINLEIADFFSEGSHIRFDWTLRHERDLTTSLAWGVYGMALLVTGMWRRMRILRFISLGFIILTIGKVFLWDLSSLEGIYRILSFLGLAVSLIIVSLLYQRFVFREIGGHASSAS